MKARWVYTTGGEWVRVYDADDVDVVLEAVRQLAGVELHIELWRPATWQPAMPYLPEHASAP